jgi:hypothetical protein
MKEGGGMIAILNVTGSDANNAVYQLQINDEFICLFHHQRNKGLAECLRKAADAVDKKMDRDICTIIQMLTTQEERRSNERNNRHGNYGSHDRRV